MKVIYLGFDIGNNIRKGVVKLKERLELIKVTG